jgi:hypothetical protein
MGAVVCHDDRRGLLNVGADRSRWLARPWWRVPRPVVGERRAVAREQRDREHEREIWARDLRREAHVAFIAEFDRKFKVIEKWLAEAEGDGPDHDYLQSINDTMTPMRLVADNETATLAFEALGVLNDYTFGKPGAVPWDAVNRAMVNYLQAVRWEFGLKTPIDYYAPP